MDIARGGPDRSRHEPSDVLMGRDEVASASDVDVTSRRLDALDRSRRAGQRVPGGSVPASEEV